MMTMRRRPLATVPDLSCGNRKGTAANIDSLMGGATRRLVLADRRARQPGRSATATKGPRYRGALCSSTVTKCHTYNRENFFC